MGCFGVAGMALCLYLTASAQSSPDDLFQAIRNNDAPALKARLAQGADVNSRDKSGNTLLMQAAAFGSPEAVKLLLDRGADVNARNAFDNTALILSPNDAEKARLLMDKGADLNARTKQGVTAAGADPDSLRVLLASGADPDANGKSGNTPLYSAAAHCDTDAMKLLLAKDARVDARNAFVGQGKFGKIQLINLTPLLWAAPYCNAGVIKPLLDAGANVNARDIREMTPLMLAVADGSWYVRSRAVKFEPCFPSGFPFDHDQCISATATARAVRPLAPTIQNEKRASR